MTVYEVSRVSGISSFVCCDVSIKFDRSTCSFKHI
jgi:hypothetical protein